MNERDLTEVSKRLARYIGQGDVHGVGYGLDGIHVYYEQVRGNSLKALNQKLLIENMTIEADGIQIHFHDCPPASLI